MNQEDSGMCISFFLAKDIFHSGRENTQQYSPPEADRHDLPTHADPHGKFALASTKGCFHAF